MQTSFTFAIVLAAASCAAAPTTSPAVTPSESARSVAEQRGKAPAVDTPAPAQEPTPPADDRKPTVASLAAKPDATYSHGGFVVTARLLDGAQPADPDGEASKTLEIRFRPSSGKEAPAALKHGTVSGCGNTEVHIDAVPELRDERLAMLNLFCENGEDVFSRQIVTALLFVGDDGSAPAVLWEGEGTFQNDFDACITIDVPYFRRTKRGAIQAMRETEVERNAGGDIPPEPECIAKKRRITVLATIPIPARALP